MVDQTSTKNTKTTKTSGRKSSPAKGTSTQATGKAGRSGAKTTGTRGRGAAATSGAGKSQAGSTRTRTPRAAPRSPAAGQQEQSTGTQQRQGEGTTSAQPAPMFGGTRQVAIEEVQMTSRGGRRQGPDPYPFSELPPSRVESGVITGPSFFVPDSENPKRVIAAGRKRHKPKIFLTRQMDGPSPTNPDEKVAGVRVWLAPPNYNK